MSTSTRPYIRSRRLDVRRSSVRLNAMVDGDSDKERLEEEEEGEEEETQAKACIWSSFLQWLWDQQVLDCNAPWDDDNLTSLTSFQICHCALASNQSDFASH